MQQQSPTQCNHSASSPEHIKYPTAICSPLHTLYIYLEDEHFEVVSLDQLSVISLQFLHLEGLLIHLVLDLLHVDADLATLLQEFADRVGGGSVALGELGHIVLDASHRPLYLDLSHLHLMLVLLHRVQHVHQLI